MSKEIIYSFKEYQEKYTSSLGVFCKNTEFDEIDFITTEIDYYSIYLTSLSIYKRIRHRSPGDPFLEEDTIFLNTNCASYDFIVEALKNKAISKSMNSTDDIIANYKIHFNKIISFLETKKSELETNSQSIMKAGDTLNWQGTHLQFTELTKALFETKLISPTLTQKEFFKRMELFFNVDEFDEKEKLKGIRARSRDLTPFINTLEISLNNWIKNKD